MFRSTKQLPGMQYTNHSLKHMLPQYCTTSSSSIDTATLVGVGLLNYRWVFSAGRFLQSAVASGTSNPQPGGPVICNVPPSATRWLQRLKRRKRTPVAEGGTMGEKLRRILPKVATSTSLLGSFTCHKFTTWDRRLYFPSEGRRTEDFFARKIRRLRPGLNPRTRVPKASTLTSRPPKLLIFILSWLNWIEWCLGSSPCGPNALRQALCAPCSVLNYRSPVPLAKFQMAPYT